MWRSSVHREVGQWVSPRPAYLPTARAETLSGVFGGVMAQLRFFRLLRLPMVSFSLGCSSIFYLLHRIGLLFRRDVCASLPLFCNVGLHDSVPRLPWCHGNLGIARSSVLVFAFINRNCCRKANSVYTLRMEPRALCAGVGQCAFLWGPGRAPGGVLYHACGACPPPLAKGCLAGILFSVICSFRRDCAREAHLICICTCVLSRPPLRVPG